VRPHLSRVIEEVDLARAAAALLAQARSPRTCRCMRRLV
jgi:hypothetical protein